MNALVDETLSSFQLKEADEGLELPRLVAYSPLGVMRDERRKSMVETKQPRQCTPDRQRDSSKSSGVSSERVRTDIVNWIEGFHNHRRLHTAIGDRTPMQFEPGRPRRRCSRYPSNCYFLDKSLYGDSR